MNISFSLGGGEQSIESLFSFSTVQEEEEFSKVSKNPNDDDNGDGVFALSGQEDNEKKQKQEEENRLLDEEAKSLTHVLKGIPRLFKLVSLIRLML